ncbi:hypothetical protein CALVIDRAFT_531119 [Calocera viscosa TUFC12733]|uniref:Uncharacterized protein n=1 Tax=Calocera viscosa (strain TUFC12733) TaxID=1330018 RepID=A0A167GYI3_CALVF|nr:hypothetical protein CALVIDRAFT_531119 [Calocera viscosa TUFC12733]
MTEVFEVIPSWAAGANEFSVYHMFDSPNREVAMVHLDQFCNLLKDEDLWNLQLEADATLPNPKVTHVPQLRCAAVTDAMGLGAAVFSWLQGHQPKPRIAGRTLTHDCSGLSSRAECIIDQVERVLTKSETNPNNLPAICYAYRRDFIRKLKRKFKELDGFVPIIPDTVEKELERWNKHQEVWNLLGCFANPVQILNGPGSGKKHGGPSRAEGWLRNLAYASVGLDAPLHKWLDAAQKFLEVINMDHHKGIEYLQSAIDKVHKDKKITKALTAKGLTQIDIKEAYPKADFSRVPQFLFETCRAGSGKPLRGTLIPPNARRLQTIGKQCFKLLDYEPRQSSVVAEQVAKPMATQLYYLQSWVPLLLQNEEWHGLYTDIVKLFDEHWDVALLDEVPNFDEANQFFVPWINHQLGPDEEPEMGWVTVDGLNTLEFQRFKAYRDDMLTTLGPFFDKITSKPLQERLEMRLQKAAHRILVAAVRHDVRKEILAAKKAARAAAKKGKSKKGKEEEQSALDNLQRLSIEQEDFPMAEAAEPESEEKEAEDDEDDEDDEDKEEAMKNAEEEENDLLMLDEEQAREDALPESSQVVPESSLPGPSQSEVVTVRTLPDRAARHKPATATSPAKRSGPSSLGMEPAFKRVKAPATSSAPPWTADDEA